MNVWEVYYFPCCQLSLSSPGWPCWFYYRAEDLSRYIVGILKPSTKESATIFSGGLVLDVGFLDRVLKMPITTVKSIPHSCRIAFSQALKTVLYKVIVQPGFVEAWICLLLLHRCTLQVFTPKNRQECMSRNRKSLQKSSILKALDTWGKMISSTRQLKICQTIPGQGPWNRVEASFRRRQHWVTPTSGSAFVRLQMSILPQQ